jgi:GNAT superfamily N-acetyltransferase
MEPSIQIRKALTHDTKEIARLCGQLGYSDDEAVVRERLKAIDSDPKHAVFVAESDSKSIAGWIHVLPRFLLISRPVAEIGGVVVDERQRRKGIGRALMSHAEKWAKENGYEGIIVRSDSRRQESHKFYPDIGYDLLKEQKVYIKFFQKT